MVFQKTEGALKLCEKTLSLFSIFFAKSEIKLPTTPPLIKHEISCKMKKNYPNLFICSGVIEFKNYSINYVHHFLWN